MNTTTRPEKLPRSAAPRLYPFLTALVTDRVLATFWLLVAALAALDVEQSLAALGFALRSFAGILPFLLLAVTLAAASRASGADRRIAGAFSGSPRWAVAVAALAGALSPFCSCGVVPVIAGLLRAGVPLAPVMAFWIASPIMDPEMFILTAAGIGIDFAVAKTLATIIMGLLAGYGVYALRGLASLSSPLRKDAGGGCAAGPDAGQGVAWRFWRWPDRRRAFQAEFAGTAFFLAKWLLLAFLLESVMMTYLPPEWIARSLGSGAWHEIPLAAVVGVPAYLNGYAAIPLVAGLMELGMQPGAAMAFMTAGAVSSIPAAMAVAVLVKHSVFALYLGLGLAGSVVTGLLYGLLV